MSDWVPECVTHGTILEFFFELLHNDYLPNGFNWKFHFTFVISLLTKCVYSRRVKWDDEWQKWPKSTRSNLTLAVSCDSRWQWLISIYPIRKISLNDSKFLHISSWRWSWFMVPQIYLQFGLHIFPKFLSFRNCSDKILHKIP